LVVTEDRTGFSPLNVYARGDKVPCQRKWESARKCTATTHVSQCYPSLTK